MLPINLNLPLKAVVARIRSCRAVLWALETHGRHLSENLGETFSPLLEEGQAMPFEVQIELFKKQLILVRDQLVSTDRAYRDQKAAESLVRGRRDTQAETVNKGVVGLRQAFTGIYSDDKLAAFGFARRTPQQPAELQEQASHLVERLEDPDLDLSGSRFGDFQLDAQQLARELVGSVESLQEADEELAREERKTEALKLAKDDALEQYNKSFLWIARTIESLCRLAGLDEAAKRVRPSSRKPGVTAQRFDESEPPPASNDAESEDSEGEENAEITAKAA